MRRLRLMRGPSTDQGTPGVLVREDGSRVAYSLELPWRENRRRKSCIPPGTYRCRWIVTAKRPAGVYLVEGVPGRDAILIHSANIAGDVDLGYETHLLGCIALGLQRGRAQGQLAVLVSKPAITQHAQEMERRPFLLEVRAWESSTS